MQGYPTPWQATLALLAWVPNIILGLVLLAGLVLVLRRLKPSRRIPDGDCPWPVDEGERLSHVPRRGRK